MGTGYLSFLQNLWPFFYLGNLDDLKISDGLVKKLSIPDQTKQFVFAIQEPESQSIIYILATQNLSKQSALDAECLIKEIRPEAVVQAVEKNDLLGDDDDLNGCSVPTSAFGVLKGCFVNKINKDEYESLAGSEVLKEIFGIGFYGHFLVAKKAAKEVGSSVLLLESAFANTNNGVEDDCGGETSIIGMSKLQALGLGSTSLVPQKLGSAVLASSKRLCLTDDVHSQMVRSLASSIALSASKLSSVTEGELQPRCDYEAPSYAQSVYSLLTDLHDIFPNLPSIGRALAYAQKMLHNVEKGETIDTQLLSEVRAFRIAVEGMRIGLNNVGRRPSNKIQSQSSSKPGFSELPTEDKSYAVFAKALRSQAKKFKSIVAIVDASSLAGLRKHWNTSVPPEVEALIEQFFTEQEGNEENLDSENVDRKSSIAKKSVVAVGAGATAVLGASSLSKVGPASTFMKLVAYKVPVSLKLSLTQTYKTIAFAFSKTAVPSKVVVHGLGSSGAKTTSIMKATASTKKIRAVAHSVIASAERTSFSAMRTAFYEIMRKRRVQPIRAMPLATFGCSMATCAGLLMYGDRIECVAESVPVAPRIASLGRGLQSLHQASHAVANGTKIREAIDFLVYTSNKIKHFRCQIQLLKLVLF